MCLRLILEISGSFRTVELFPKLSHVQQRVGPFSPLQRWCQPARLSGESGGTARCSEHSLAGEGHKHRQLFDRNPGKSSPTKWNKLHSTAPLWTAGSLPCMHLFCLDRWAGCAALSRLGRPSLLSAASGSLLCQRPTCAAAPSVGARNKEEVVIILTDQQN